MQFATESRRTQILVWLIWAIACIALMVVPEQAKASERPVIGPPALMGVVTHDPRAGPLFPWQPRHRLRKWAWRRYCALRRAHLIEQLEAAGYLLAEDPRGGLHPFSKPSDRTPLAGAASAQLASLIASTRRHARQIFNRTPLAGLIIALSGLGADTLAFRTFR